MAVFFLLGCRSQQIASQSVNDLPQGTMHRVRELVEIARGDRFPGRFKDPIPKEVLGQMKAIPGYKQTLTAILKEQLEEELSPLSEDWIVVDYPLMIHICDIMAELGDPTFTNSLETLQERTRIWCVRSAASRALKRIRQPEK